MQVKVIKTNKAKNITKDQVIDVTIEYAKELHSAGLVQPIDAKIKFDQGIEEVKENGSTKE